MPSNKQLHRLIERGAHPRSLGCVLGQHHKSLIDRDNRVRDGVGIELIRKLCAVGAQAVAEQQFELAVEGRDPLSDLLVLAGAVDRGVDREAAPAALDAGAARDEPASQRSIASRADGPSLMMRSAFSTM